MDMENKSLVRLLVVMLLCGSMLIAHVPVVQGDLAFKQITGIVDPNSSTSVRAYDPVQNGFIFYYIQNRTNEGNGTDPIESMGPGQDYYDPEIQNNITDWIIDDECILIIEREFGTYGVDHAGYITFFNVTLNGDGVQIISPPIELLKIPTPTFDSNGTGFINVSWTPLPDLNGLVAGYKVYRSETNSSDGDWELVGGATNSPITDNYFKDPGVNPDTTYYYSLRLSFMGYMNNNPGNVDNYQNQYFGEGSAPMSSPSSLLTLDYILIEYGNGTEVISEMLDVDTSTPQVYAQGYNNSGGGTLIGPQVVDWTINPVANGSVAPVTDTYTVFTANFLGGWVTVTATIGLLSDTFDVYVNPPTVDSIVLEYINGTEIQDMTFNMSGPALEIYAAGYNGTFPGWTFIGYQTVTWEDFTISGGTGNFNVTPGDTASYTGMTPGGLEVRGTYAPGVFDNFILNNVWGIPPVIDEIRITYGNGTEITSLTLDILQQYEIFAEGFNLSSGAPIDLVEAAWEVGTGGSIDITPGLSTNFTAGTAGATVTVNATYMSLPQAQLSITINAPTLDTISITNPEDGVDLVSELISTSGSVTAYASGYNITGTTYTYVGLVSVTWSLNTTSYGTISPGSGTSTVFTPSAAGMVLISADDGLGHTDNFTIEIRVFTLDYIEITDAFDGTLVDDIFLDVGAEIMVYASGYNSSTVPGIYTGPVDVTWTQAPNTIGTFSNATGTSTLFTAGMAADELYTTTITGANTGLAVTDSFTLNINPPTLDYIEIRNATGEGGDAITSDEFTLGETRLTQTYYCAGYNDTSGYIRQVDADAWTLDTAIGTVAPAAGTSTLFTATTAGSGILMANFSGITDSITITVNAEDDTTPPATPTGLTVTVGTAEKTLEITWDVNTDDAIGYNIYRSDSATGTFVKLNTALLTDTSYTDTGLAYDTAYYYKVSAVDNATNESPQTTTAVSGTTAAEPDGDGDGDGKDDEVPWILILLPIIIIIVLLVMYLMMKKKKPEEEAAPPEEEKKELPPPPGAKAEPEVEEVEEVEEEELPPPEEEPEPAEDEGETKPTDSEEKPPEE